MARIDTGMEFCTQRVQGAFLSPHLLLTRAKEHITDLERWIALCLSPDRWTCLVEIDPDTGDQLAKVRFGYNITLRASVIAMDVVNNLRATLDHAVYASSLALFGGEPKNTRFPMGSSDEKSFQDDLTRLRKSKAEISPEIVDLIASFKPYETGNLALSTLNKLRNRKAHRVLTAISIAAGTWDANVIHHSKGTISGGAWDATKNELTMAVIPKGSDIAVDIRTFLQVALNGAPGMDSEPAVTAFHTFASEVERILMAIQAETFRLLRVINP